MKYILGVPGQDARVIVDSDNYDRVLLQLKENEVALPIGVAPRFPKIATDGNSIEDQPLPDKVRLDEIRTARNAKLAQTDWTQISDSSVTGSKKAAWTLYRKALRDITTTQPMATLETIVWPTEPAA